MHKKLPCITQGSSYLYLYFWHCSFYISACEAKPYRNVSAGVDTIKYEMSIENSKTSSTV